MPSSSESLKQHSSQSSLYRTLPMTALVRELWGGAALASMPERLQDVSDFRPVPDHQEVWADGSTDQSFIFEINEAASVSDQEAAQFFFKDLAEASDATQSTLEHVEHLDPTTVVPGALPGATSCSIASGIMHMSKGRQGADAANVVQVDLAVVRLPSVASDLLVQLLTPTVISAHSASAEHAGAGPHELHRNSRALMLSVLNSLKVVDWTLFG